MLNVEELEEQWKRYDRKRKRPFYIVGILLLSTIIAVIVVVNQKLDLKNIKEFFISISKSYNQDNTNMKKDLNTKVFVPDMYLLNSSIKELILVTDIKSKPTDKPKSSTPLDDDELYIEKDISKPLVKKKRISIIQVSNNNAYKDVERRFKRSHNINDSMFLANIYYKKRNYKRAIYWSMQTNKLNKNIEESWLIFAKSKVKLGRKNEAIRVLKAYIKRSNSYEARKLLKKIMNN